MLFMMQLGNTTDAVVVSEEGKLSYHIITKCCVSFIVRFAKQSKAH